MSSTTITINENEKKKLQLLQARVLSLTDKKVSIPKLIELILKLEEETIVNLVLREVGRQDKAKWKHHEDMMQDIGFEISENIDDVIYGLL